MGRVNVNYKEKQSISDVFTLTNVVTNESVSLIPSDSEGNFNWRGITKAPLTRNAMQTTQSSGEWSDLEYPWQAIQQEDWTGGRANLRFTTDKSRFFDSKRAQTAFNACIYNAPLEYYSEGIGRTVSTNCPGSLYWESLRNKYIAVSFQPVELEAGEVYIHLRKRGEPETPLTVQLTDSLGSGGNVLASHDFTTEEVTDTLAEFYKFTFEEITLTEGDTYYVKVTSEGNSSNYWQVGCRKGSGMNTFVSADGDNYDVANFELYYRVSAEQNDYSYKFFTYEQLTFAVRQETGENGNASLWLNGDIGAATSAASDTITDTSKTWTVNQWKGAQLGIVYGEGSEEHVSCWKKIISNDSESITVESDFVITPTAGTVYIINDTPYWHEVENHQLSEHITDVHVIRGVVYFCMGDYVDVKKMRWDSGSFGWKTLTGIKATFLQSVRDRNGLMLYRARNDDNGKRTVDKSMLIDWGTDTAFNKITTAVTTTNGAVATNAIDFGGCDYDKKQYMITVGSFSSDKLLGRCIIMLQESEDGKAWQDVQSITIENDGVYYITAHCRYGYRRFKLSPSGTNCSLNNIEITTTQIPHFVDKVIMLDNYGKITRLFEYGAEQEKSLWIFQEGMVSSINKTEGQIDTYNLDRINLDELWTTADEHNGKAVGTTDVYLLWSWLNGLQRFYNTQLEGKGPDHNEGMPADMRGRISAIQSYPSNFFVSIDAGEDGYSSVMQFNGNGWHNIYRAPNKGERIRDIGFQPIYGDRPDRLWINVGDDIIWLAMPSKILYAIHDPNAEYTHESVVVSAWLTGGMAEVDKLWQSLSIMADYLEDDVCYIEADYQLDDEEAWHPIPTNPFNTSPQQEELFAGESESVNGKKLRYRLRLQTTDMNKTPKVNVVLIKALGRVDIKYSYSFAFRNMKYKADLTGEYEELEPYELDEILSEWANNLATLRLNSAYKLFDNKRVFLDALQTSVVYEKGEGYLSQITLTEI